MNTTRIRAWLCALFIFAFNIFLCHELFRREFTVQMASIESSYITIAQWITKNWTDLTWFPLWFNGQSFHSVYQPGFHVAVAALATLAGMTPQHAYHFFTGITYSLVPVSLFLLCYLMTKQAGFGAVTALLYSLISPVCFFSPLSRLDAGAWPWPRRYQILVHYGEGPHTTAVAMIPLVILILHAALTGRKRIWIALSPLAVAAVAITNWPGSVGLAMAILAYCVSRIGAPERFNWFLLIGSACSRACWFRRGCRLR